MQAGHATRRSGEATWAYSTQSGTHLKPVSSRLAPSGVIARDEYQKSHDMKEHARRLSRFHEKTAGKVWMEQPNGEMWLVDVYDGATGLPVEPE